MLDITISVLALILLAPLLLYVALRVRLSSPGPILHIQERVGRHRQKFMMHKFRSMYLDAELHGPQLSVKNDSRITPWGRVMRKWRLDELPQFWNVLKGDMTIVGPRPEREFYARELERIHPEYGILLEVKPGLTSMGMVKFGYAGNVEEMIKRIRYDLIYIRNRSLSLDFRIMWQTITIIAKGKGR